MIQILVNTMSFDNCNGVKVMTFQCNYLCSHWGLVCRNFAMVFTFPKCNCIWENVITFNLSWFTAISYTYLTDNSSTTKQRPWSSTENWQTLMITTAMRNNAKVNFSIMHVNVKLDDFIKSLWIFSSLQPCRWGFVHRDICKSRNWFQGMHG